MTGLAICICCGDERSEHLPTDDPLQPGRCTGADCLCDVDPDDSTYFETARDPVCGN